MNIFLLLHLTWESTTHTLWTVRDIRQKNCSQCGLGMMSMCHGNNFYLQQRKQVQRLNKSVFGGVSLPDKHG